MVTHLKNGSLNLVLVDNTTLVPLITDQMLNPLSYVNSLNVSLNLVLVDNITLFFLIQIRCSFLGVVGIDTERGSLNLVLVDKITYDPLISDQMHPQE